MMRELVRDRLVAPLGEPFLKPMEDAALLPCPGADLAFTTDGFVVTPLFFPGGDIGTLAVNGTVNDLAVSLARPLYLSCALILEEGFPLATLDRVVDSLAAAARAAGVHIVTGDTKVVERGKGDGIFVSTAGIGARMTLPEGARRRSPLPGDRVLVSGPVGDHGAVILAARAGMEPGEGLASDCAPLTPLVEALLRTGVLPLALRDPTRGGLATVLDEWAEAHRIEIEVEEDAVPVRTAVAGLCELLGIDPYLLACEGRLVALVADSEAPAALAALRSTPGGEGAAIVGSVVRGALPGGRVVVRTRFGGRRVLDLPRAELLPRIC